MSEEKKLPPKVEAYKIYLENRDNPEKAKEELEKFLIRQRMNRPPMPPKIKKASQSLPNINQAESAADE